jgi:hypothetical protein
MKIVILNDTSSSGHFGCKLVMDALHENFKRRGCQVIGTVPWTEHWRNYKDLMDKADLIVVNGEGSIHHGNRMELLKVAVSYPSVLINAVYQDVPDNDYLKAFKYVSVRESRSKLEMVAHGVTPEVVPDLLFFHKIEKPEIAKLSEQSISVTDSVCGDHGLDPHDEDFIQKFGESRIGCVGRFHAACLAMTWNMPFTAYPSNTHKTLGMLEDAGKRYLYGGSKQEAFEILGEMTGENDFTGYVEDARQKIDAMFNKILNINPAETNVHLNVTETRLLKNIEAAMSRGLPEFKPGPPSDMPIAIVGGGPSLKETYTKLLGWPGFIVSTNNTHDFLIERGIIPHVHVMMDASPLCAGFVSKPHKDVKYLIASSCSPKVFKALKRADVTLWHQLIDIGEPDHCLRIGGASTVGLRSIYLMHTAGFNQFHMFGMDSCITDSHHAYDQKFNDEDLKRQVMVTVGENNFMAAPWMIHQAQEFKGILTQHSDKFTLYVHGEGLLAAIINEAHRLAHREKYYASA